jgi:MFS superfamily sulfate permease-like transporter
MTTLDVVTTAHTHPEHVPGDADPWLTATIRPAGSFGRADAGRLRALLDALSACASIVVLDLRSARLRSRGAAAVVEDAAQALEGRGGCLLCVHADAESRAHLAEAGERVVILDEDPHAA